MRSCCESKSPSHLIFRRSNEYQGTGKVVASVLARLRNNSKSSGAPFQQVFQQYAMERFLYRISKSKHAKSVILKGALLLKTIGIPSARPTLDIDMLHKGRACLLYTSDAADDLL